MSAAQRKEGVVKNLLGLIIESNALCNAGFLETVGRPRSKNLFGLQRTLSDTASGRLLRE
jgi:hypothetical protein